MIDKIQRNATDEFLPEEMILMMREEGGVSPPVELDEQQICLVWYMTEYIPSSIESIATFPGVRRITLREPSQKISSKNSSLFKYFEDRI